MIIHITCNYCDFKWEKNIYTRDSVSSEVCPKCKDTNLKVKDAKQDKIDYYEGSPAFRDDDELDYDTYL